VASRAVSVAERRSMQQRYERRPLTLICQRRLPTSVVPDLRVQHGGRERTVHPYPSGWRDQHPGHLWRP
jgi:hypothetical protein